MRLLSVICAICAVTLAQAQEAPVRCNEHGAVVSLGDGTVYYLGKSCDAAEEGGGTGTWFLSASALVVDIDDRLRRLEFDIDCDLPACWSE